MSTLLDLRQSVVEAISLAIFTPADYLSDETGDPLLDENGQPIGAPAIAGVCQAHGGRFDKTELARLSVQTPAILVACLGVSRAEDDGAGGRDLWPVMGAFILCTDKPQAPRDSAALALASALLVLVAGNQWGREDTGYPEKVRAENLYTGKVDATGLALWAVVWEQKMTCGSFDASSLDRFITFHADYDMAPKDGAIEATDVVILPQDYGTE